MEEPLSAKERVSGVHFAEDVMHLCPLRAGATVEVKCRVASVRARRHGCTVVLHFEHRDSITRVLYCTQLTTIYYRGVSLADSLSPPPQWSHAAQLPPVLSSAASGTASPVTTRDIAIGPFDAHVYTECARIWNPIHTDKQVALAAGLSDIILHGTATMAKAVSVLVDEYCGGDPLLVRRAVVRKPLAFLENRTARFVTA